MENGLRYSEMVAYDAPKYAKITNSNRRAFKTARKRLYFSDFKERLAHFNGTVVIIVWKYGLGKLYLQK